MSSAAVRLTLSALATNASAPVVRRMMLAAGTLDVPNHRSSHTVAVPRGGGIACLVGVGVGLMPHPRVVSTRDLLTVVTLAAVGLADDRRGGLPALPRLTAQCCAGLACGGQHSVITALGGALLLPGVVNVVNFMDGINGISGLTALVWGGLAVTCPGVSHSTVTLGAVTAGAGLGFLPHNLPTAQLFLGDVGSYLLGALMGAALIQSLPQPKTTLRLGAPLLPYAADAAQAMWRRGRRGEALLEAHREHVYQRIVDEHGVSHTAMAVAHALTSLSIGILTRSSRPVLSLGGVGLALGAYVAAPRLIGLWRKRSGK